MKRGWLRGYDDAPPPQEKLGVQVESRHLIDFQKKIATLSIFGK